MAEIQGVKLMAHQCATTSVDQYHFLKDNSTSSATQTIVALAGAGTKAIGVSQTTTPSSGTHNITYAECAGGGVTWLMCDGTTDLAVGDWLKPDANGHGVKADTNKDVASAIILEAYTTDSTKLCLVRLISPTALSL